MRTVPNSVASRANKFYSTLYGVILRYEDKFGRFITVQGLYEISC